MNIGVLGGTHFLGRHIVKNLISNLYNITLINNCKSNLHLYPHLNRMCADRYNREEMNLLDARHFDCVIDTSWEPSMIWNTIHSNKINTDYYVYLSSCSIYDWPLEDDGSPYYEYVQKKIQCEQLILNKYGEKNSLIIRPGYICGEHDNTNRFDYSEWPVVRWKEPPHQKLLKYDDVEILSKWIVNELINNKKVGYIDSTGGAFYREDR
tara:strand:- start:994 stop:1620 length:627 start_codon:yes stop_codon:yes gene_type:complete